MENKSFLINTTELNAILRKHYPRARVKDRRTLEGSDAENLMMAIVEPGKSLVDLISEIYKVECVEAIYEEMDKVKITYLERDID